MARQPENLRSGANYTSADFGAPASWYEHGFVHPRRGEVKGKVFLRQSLGLTATEVSFGMLPPGESISFLHAHRQNEELYIVVGGRGEFQVDGEVIPLQPGTAVRVAPGGVRCWRAVGDEPLAYVVIQAKQGSLEAATANDGIVPPQPPSW